MFYKKMIFYFYIFLTVIVFLTPTVIPIVTFTPVIVFLWLTYGLFCVGIRLGTSKSIVKTYANAQVLTLLTSKKIFIFTLCVLVFTPLYVKFYTGNSLFQSLILFFSGSGLGADSTYYTYQTHFNDANLGQFSLTKLPYILINGVLKYLLWFFVIGVVGYCNKGLKLKNTLLVICLLMFFFVGISRGTSFEAFEILLIILYSVLNRASYFEGKSWVSGRTKYLTYSFIMLGILYFIISKSMRYEGDIIFTDVTETLKVDKSSFIIQYLPVLGLLLNNISGYFLFGPFFISSAITNIWLSSVSGFLSILFPFGTVLFGLGDSYRKIICENFIDCGAAWVPDSMVLIGNIGIIGYVLVVMFLGFLSSKCYEKTNVGSLKHSLVLFIIVLVMFSLPIGNFITASSASVLVVVIAIFSLLRDKVINK